MQTVLKSGITIWGAGTARTMRPVWVAEELGLSYRLAAIGPRTGETKTPQYTQLNPKQKIPFYTDEYIQLSESVAICRYLINRHGSESTLLPSNSIEQQAKEDEWVSFIYGELDETSLYVIRRHEALAHIYGEAPNAISAAKEYVLRQLTVVEQFLQSKEFLLEERFSLADVFLTTCLDWVHVYGITMPSSLQDYRTSINQRPAYLKARAINYDAN
ncbi:MAG TPA: glutathione S-transferase family protein [Porticoccaceae bacterium]|nr:glutathione S-transferase family protein [Porticoccaceae bacterium]